jgi:succinoglycan biosynthesis protein ExoA
MKASNSKPTVSVVVPCRNEREHIEAALNSILAQGPPPGGFEVIIADGMSDDGTRDILARMTAEDMRLRVIDNTERIVSAGLNAAIRIAKGNIILRMDAHSEYAPDYIVQCLATLKDSGADNVGGPARTKSQGYIQSAICAAYHSSFAVGGARFHNVNYEGYVDTVPYGCWRRKVFDRVGLFDEELLNTEDDEFNLRLTRHGGKVWQSPRIKSWYHPRESLRSLLKQQKQYGYWKVRVIRKHRVLVSIRHLVPACFVLSLLALPLASLWDPVAIWIWFLIVGAYLISNVAASFIAAARGGWKTLPLLPVVFACYHFGYGYGFLRGIGDFLIFKRQTNSTYTELTRSSAGSIPKDKL